MAGRRRVGRTTFVVAAAVLAVSLAAGTAAVLGSPGADKAAAPPAATPAGIACPADLAVPDGAPRLAADFSPWPSPSAATRPVAARTADST
ncbi:hypothetical protein [Phytohabitans houttuyneae]|nr:hypothetical protein [Phytohabitans houttuyneae]